MFKSHTIKKRLKCMQYNEIKWTVLLKKAEAVPTAITYHIILIVRCIFIEGFIEYAVFLVHPVTRTHWRLYVFVFT